MASPKKDQEGVRAVDRALEILLAFSAKNPELTVSDLQKCVELSRPTLYRLLYALEQNRFLTSYGEPKRFRLGPAVAQLAHVWNASLNVAAVADPILHKVWEETGETAVLFVREGVFRVCVAELPSTQPLSFKRGVGYREKLAVGASGRAILAHVRPAAGDLKTHETELQSDIKKYVDELADIRKRGFAMSRDELIKGAVAVAAPFFDGTNQVVGSLGIFGPSVRLPTAQAERFGKLLVREARQLSRLLGQARSSAA